MTDESVKAPAIHVPTPELLLLKARLAHFEERVASGAGGINAREEVFYLGRRIARMEGRG